MTIRETAVPVPWPAGEGEMAARLREHDWAATSLGPIEDWPTRLRTLVELMLASSQAAGIVCAPDRILLYNDASIASLGGRHPEALGQPARGAFPESAEALVPLYDRAFRGESVEARALPLDLAGAGAREARAYDLCLTPLPETDGATRYVHTLGFDVGPRIEAERALQEAQEREREREFRLGGIFDTAPVGLSLIDGKGRFLRVNGELSRILDRPAAELLTLGVSDVTHPDDLARSLETLERSLRTGRTQTMDKRYRRPSGELVPANSTLTPLLTASGPAVIVAVTMDLTDRTRAEQAMRDSEERLRLAMIIGHLATWDWNMLTGEIEWSDEHYRIHGYEVGEVRPSYEAWIERVHPDDREGAAAALAAARDERREFVREFRSLHPDGTIRWCSGRGHFFYDASGTPVRMIGVMQDVTEAREAVRALEESEERMRQFGEASSDVLWIRDAETLQWTYLTPAFRAIYGLPRREALEGNDFRNWVDLIEPDDRPTAIDAMRRVRHGESVSFDYRVRRPLDGSIRWLRNTDFPIRDENGDVTAIGGIGRDITEERALAERQQVLVAELQHRTRNLLGVVRSIAGKTAANATSLEEFMPPFRERLTALSRINGLLSKLEKGERVTFEELVRTELEARGVHGPAAGNRVTLDGPEGVRLRSGTVQTFALAIHELTTNAVKYGALADGTGHLTVRWSVRRDDEGGERLFVEWTETGVTDMPAIGSAPRGGGYGRELIERALPYQLQARTSYELGREGVRCTIDLPLGEP